MNSKHKFLDLFWHYLELGEFTQEGLGAAIIANKSSISRWINGKRRLPANVLEKICNTFGLKGEDREEFVAAYHDFWNTLKQTNSVDDLDAPIPLNVLSSKRTNLPVPPKHFTGRDDEITQIIDCLQPGQIVVVQGVGGIGKTSLVAKAIEKLYQQDPLRFPDGLCYYSFYKEAATDAALDQIYRTLVKDEKPEPNPLAALMRELTSKQALIILDGAEEADNLRRIIEVLGDCGVLIGTQSHSHTLYGHAIELKALSLEHSVELIQSLGKEYADDIDALKAICRFLDGWTIGMEITGFQLKATKKSASVFLNWLESEPMSALHLVGGKSRRENLWRLIGRSLSVVSSINPIAHHIISLMGIFSFSSVALDVLAEGLSLPKIKIIEPIVNLVNFGLLVEEEERFQLRHSLIHSYAQELFSDVSPQMVRRLANYYITFIHEQIASEAVDFTLLNMERSHIMAIAVVCEKYQLWDLVTKLAVEISPYLSLQGYLTDLEIISTRGLHSAKVSSDYPKVVGFLDTLGTVHLRLGRLDEALKLYQEALAAAQNIEDLHLLSRALLDIGIVYYKLQQYSQAYDYTQEALAIARDIKSVYLESSCLGNLSSIHSALHHSRIAVEYQLEALKKSPHLISSYNNLAIEYAILGDLDKAEILYKERIRISPQDALFAYTDLGVITYHQGRFSESKEYFHKALDVWQFAWDTKLASACALYECKALALLGIGESQEAITVFKKCLSERTPDKIFYPVVYDLLEKPNSLSGIKEIRHLLDEILIDI